MLFKRLYMAHRLVFVDIVVVVVVLLLAVPRPSQKEAREGTQRKSQYCDLMEKAIAQQYWAFSFTSLIFSFVLSLCTFPCNTGANYSQLSPCGHLAITDTQLIRTAAKSPAKVTDV